MVVRQRAHKGDGGSPSSEKARKPGPFSGRFNPKLQKSSESAAGSTFLPHRTWSRIVMICSVLAIVYISSSSKSNTIMAKQKDLIHPKRYQQFLCAPSYKNEILDTGNSGCVPAKCGRMVTDTLISNDEANELLLLAKKGMSKGGGNGGASILDLHSGALSKGDVFSNVYLAHPDLFAPSDFDTYRAVKDKVKNAVAEHFGLDSGSLHLTHPTFFSRLDDKPARTPHDEYWHVHVDKVTYPEFHYTSLLYLTDHGKDFTGGEFVFVDVAHDKLNRTVEPRMGRVSMFTSGIENKHYVERVTGGTRYALTIGFSCNPSNAIPEPGTEAHETFHKSKTQSSQ